MFQANQRQMMLRIALVVLATTGLGLSEASAKNPKPTPLNIFQMVEWACDESGDAPSALAQQVADTCTANINKDDKTVCDVLSGDPWACYSHSKGPTSRLCSEATASVGVTASASILAWEVTGTVTITTKTTYTFEGEACNLGSPVTKADANGGTYVSEQGTGKVHMDVTFKGDGSVSFLGLTFSVELKNDHCENSFEVGLIRTNKIESCRWDLSEDDLLCVGPECNNLDPNMDQPGYDPALDGEQHTSEPYDPHEPHDPY